MSKIDRNILDVENIKKVNDLNNLYEKVIEILRNIENKEREIEKN